MIAWNGIIRVNKIRKNAAFFPLKFILAKGYAARDEKIKFKITVKAATMKLFIAYLIIGTNFKTS